MDHLIGGPARTRGRTNPDRFVKGDMLDSWQILGMDEGRRLDLLFNMKAPGMSRLELNILPEESGLTRIRVTAQEAEAKTGILVMDCASWLRADGAGCGQSGAVSLPFGPYLRCLPEQRLVSCGGLVYHG